MIYTLAFCILCILYVVLMLLYRFGFGKEQRKKDAKARAEVTLPFFSIIIPARNEADNIAVCLQSILNNNYPGDQYEIILIDDFSTDQTADIATDILHPPHRVLRLKDHLSAEERINAYKKKALEIAIQQSTGDYIITTDADCTLPSQWLHLFASAVAEQGVHFVAAPVSFTPYQHNKSWLYYFQSLDFMTMQGITVASNKLNLGNMCNGANMLFSRQAFEAVDGYRDIDHKASGDDMMLMQKIQRRFPDSIRYLFEQSAIVETPVQPDFSSFINQRIRWASKADSYPQFKMTLILLVVYLFNCSLLCTAVISLIWPSYFLVLLWVLFIKVLAELFFLFPVARFYRKKSELIFFIFLQPLHILYIVIAGFLGKFGTYSWKGRTVQ
ncbi:Beta-monoglucosyldiacylglycerol synthase [compost metagenome]